MIPPLFLVLNIRTEGFRLPLWLPLFLVWPLVGVVLGALALVALPFFLGAWLLPGHVSFGKKGGLAQGPRLRKSLPLLWGVWRLLCCLRGTRVSVKTHDTRVFVSLW